MIDNLLNEYENLNNQENSALDNYDLNSLWELYITYAKPKYFKQHENMSDILIYISSYIMNNISKNSFLENMDLYTKILIEVINLENEIESSNNIISIRSNNLKDDFFLEFESKTFNMKKEEYTEKYEKELNNFKENLLYYKRIYELIDNFQKIMFNYLDSYIKQLSDDDKKKLLIQINKKIEDNSLEIINRIELRKDKKRLELESRFKDISVSELIDLLDIAYLKEQNYVYNNFGKTIEDLHEINKK